MESRQNTITARITEENSLRRTDCELKNISAVSLLTFEQMFKLALLSSPTTDKVISDEAPTNATTPRKKNSKNLKA